MQKLKNGFYKSYQNLPHVSCIEEAYKYLRKQELVLLLAQVETLF